MTVKLANMCVKSSGSLKYFVLVGFLACLCFDISEEARIILEEKTRVEIFS